MRTPSEWCHSIAGSSADRQAGSESVAVVGLQKEWPSVIKVQLTIHALWLLLELILVGIGVLAKILHWTAKVHFVNKKFN